MQEVLIFCSYKLFFSKSNLPLDKIIYILLFVDSAKSSILGAIFIPNNSGGIGTILHEMSLEAMMKIWMQ
jgi:hypothetical protein